jgi:hypothetical protein
MATPYRACIVGLSTSSTAAINQTSSVGTPVVPLSSISGLANSSINTGAYPTFFPNYSALGTAFAVTALIVSTNSFQFEYTLDAGTSSPFISSAATWISSGSITGSSSGVFISLPNPVTALRLNVTAGSTVQATLFTVLQSG